MIPNIKTINMKSIIYQILIGINFTKLQIIWKLNKYKYCFDEYNIDKRIIYLYIFVSYSSTFFGIYNKNNDYNIKIWNIFNFEL